MMKDPKNPNRLISEDFFDVLEAWEVNKRVLWQGKGLTDLKWVQDDILVGTLISGEEVYGIARDFSIGI
jgi:hypothetical protein